MRAGRTQEHLHGQQQKDLPVRAPQKGKAMRNRHPDIESSNVTRITDVARISISALQTALDDDENLGTTVAYQQGYVLAVLAEALNDPRCPRELSDHILLTYFPRYPADGER